MHVVLSDDALADLQAIRDYLEPRSAQGCQHVLIAIFTLLDQLERFPLLGRYGKVEGTRELSVPRYPYLIVYSLPDAYHVEIDRVLHTSMDYPIEA